jgi:hypothetical protein
VRQTGIGSALLKFDVSTLPEGTAINSARLKICAISNSNPNRGYFTAYPVQEPWGEATAVWPEPVYGAPAGWDYLPKGPMMLNGTPSDFDNNHVAKRVGTLCAEFDLDPAVVAGWLADPGSNHGLIVRGEGVTSVEAWFTSREHPATAIRPQLTVGYETP